MLFNSLSFAVFLPIVFCIYWLCPHRYRWFWLLLTSYYFYMSWNAKYVFLVLFTTVVSYSSALLLEKTDSKEMKKFILIITGIICLGVLLYFKYFNFLSKSVVSLLELFTIKLNPITVDVLLPVGISFYTFQAFGYVIDVFKGKNKAERHFGYFATFISFFPQLVAGPIERTVNLLPQIKANHTFDYSQATYGLKLMAWGFFKKLVIADVISKYVQLVFDGPQSFHGFALVLASFFFTIQIYCDFSGYSDIAIGTAKLLGINLMTNFKNPYLSQSIKEFWARWHVSLSTWFRDYVYIPLGGNREGVIKRDINLLITFFVSGLWHGANWTFMSWGGLHGLALILENHIFGASNKRMFSFSWCIHVTIVFCFCVFAWIFFVSHSLSDSLYIILHIFDGIKYPIQYLKDGCREIGLHVASLESIALNLALLAVWEIISLKTDVINLLSKQVLPIRWCLYVLLVLYIAYSGASGHAEFVYFQF